MALSRRIARPLLASMFIAGGIDALRHPATKVDAARAVTGPLARAVPAVPDDPELLIQVNGAVQVGAGVLLAVGRFRRLAALALIGSIVPTTFAGHRFWEEDDEATRAQQQVHFLKNLGLLGGLILAAFDTEGEPSLGWRARRRAARIGAAVALGSASGTSSARNTGASLVDGATGLARHAQDAATGVGRHLDEGATLVAKHAPDVVDLFDRAMRQADQGSRHLADVVPGATDHLASTLADTGQRAADTVSRAADTVTRAARTGADALAPYLATGTDRAGDLVERAQGALGR